MNNHRAPRHSRSKSVARWLITFLAVLCSLSLVTTAAYAYWTTTGKGSGSATTGTLAPPTNVSASNSSGSTSVLVAWTASSGTPTPTGYYVERKASGGGSAPACVSSAANLLTTTTCSDTSVPDGTYTYVVTAVYRSWTATGSPSSSVTVLATLATTTSVKSSGSPSQVGQQVTYTATVTASSGTPTGSVSFFDAATAIACSGGNQTLTDGIATCQVTYAAPGTRQISAQYSGGTGYAGSTSPVFTQSIGKSSTTTSLVSSANPSVVGQSIMFTATVVPVAPGAGLPTGSVSIKDGSSVLCTASLDTTAKASCSSSFSSVAGSPRSLTAVYGGDTAFITSASSVLSQAVSKASTTVTVTASPSPSRVGQAVTYTATVAAVTPGDGTPTGTVTFADGNGTLACATGTVTLALGIATCQVTYSTSGSRTVTASYSGDSNYVSSSGSAIQTVSATTSITSLTLGNKAGGTAGLLESGDQLSIRFSAGLTPSSICSAWTGTSPFTTSLALHISNPGNSGGNNIVSFDSWANCATAALGSVDLGSGNYVVSGGNSSKPVDFGATATYDATTNSITITLGAQSSASGQGTIKSAAASVATLTLSSTIKDVNGFAIVPLTKQTASGVQF